MPTWGSVGSLWYVHRPTHPYPVISQVPANERRRLVESLQQRMMQADLAWFIKEADVCTGRLSGGQGAGAGQSSAEAPRKRWWFGGAGRGRRTGAVAPAT